MQTKADRERKKQEKAEQASREAQEAILQAARDARAAELQPFLNKLVSYYDEGWRVGTLASISDNNKTAVIQPIQTRWMSAAPRKARVLVMDVVPIEQQEVSA